MAERANTHQIRQVWMVCISIQSMSLFRWVAALWRNFEPIERLDWFLEALGLRERARQMIAAAMAGLAAFIYERFREASADWVILVTIGIGGLAFYFLNQISLWSNYKRNFVNLIALNPAARPTIRFWTSPTDS